MPVMDDLEQRLRQDPATAKMFDGLSGGMNVQYLVHPSDREVVARDAQNAFAAVNGPLEGGEILAIYDAISRKEPHDISNLADSLNDRGITVTVDERPFIGELSKRRRGMVRTISLSRTDGNETLAELSCHRWRRDCTNRNGQGTIHYEVYPDRGSFPPLPRLDEQAS